MTDKPTVWVIRFRDDTRMKMVTNPSPYFAKNENERDWYLKNLTRPLEKFVVEQIPGPLNVAIAAEQKRWQRVKTELRRETRQRFLDSQQKKEQNP
ncbi:MAG TPA: hypothetical protein VFG15_06245 [Amycolatopsis sp.]|nr:hypothetical protein [Amycolatopsis sp.]